MKINISGLPGAGKSTVGQKLAKKLGLKFYSMGDVRGKMAMEKGMTIDELNKLGETEEWTDVEADKYQKEIAKDEDGFIIDSLLGFYFIPDAMKILLDVDLEVAAQRIFNDQREDEVHHKTKEGVLKMLKSRIAQNNLRYKKYYNIDSYLDKSNFDLVIDTTNILADEVVDRMLKFVREKGRL